MTYDELVELAGLCSRNSRITTSKEVATELWRMATELCTRILDKGVGLAVAHVADVGDCMVEKKVLRQSKLGSGTSRICGDGLSCELCKHFILLRCDMKQYVEGRGWRDSLPIVPRC